MIRIVLETIPYVHSTRNYFVKGRMHLECVLSPFLFTDVANVITELVSESVTSEMVSESVTSEMVSADDIFSVSETTD